MGAMCIGERIHIVRFGGKVFGQVQGDAAAGSLLSSRCDSLLFSRSRNVSFLRLFFKKRSLLLLPPPSLSLSLSLSPSRFRARPSGLFVSFRFSFLKISLWCARGDLGARPPTRELVNYFAQRDTSFLTLSSTSLLLSRFFFLSRSSKHTTMHCASYIRKVRGAI